MTDIWSLDKFLKFNKIDFLLNFLSNYYDINTQLKQIKIKRILMAELHFRYLSKNIFNSKTRCDRFTVTLLSDHNFNLFNKFIFFISYSSSEILRIINFLSDNNNNNIILIKNTLD